MEQKRGYSKFEKICLVCGTKFMGTEASFSCSGKCRARLKRIIDDGRRPQFYLAAALNEQKLPQLKEEKRGVKIVSVSPTPNVSPMINPPVKDDRPFRERLRDIRTQP